MRLSTELGLPTNGLAESVPSIESQVPAPSRGILGSLARIALPFYFSEPQSNAPGLAKLMNPAYQVGMESVRLWGALAEATYFAPRTSTPEAAQADLIYAGLLIAVPSVFQAIQESRSPAGRVVTAVSGWLGDRVVDVGIAIRRGGATLGREIQGSK